VRNHCFVSLVMVVVAIWCAGVGYADELSIYQIQSTTSVGDVSFYNGEIHDVIGGVVTHIWQGVNARVYLQDPSHPTWGAIVVKDGEGGELTGIVSVGDWVSFDNIYIDEFRGTTFLQYLRSDAPDVAFNIVSRDNPLPPAILIPVAAIPAPLQYPGDEWYVDNHDAELYESMHLVIRDVTVTAMHLGKAVDNYNLQTPNGDDCWATDYMNDAVQPTEYHEFVGMDQHFCAVSGVFEQYTKTSAGWDYYQLITLETADLAICGDGDSDGDVKLDDVPRFHECFGGPSCDGVSGGCDPPAWTTSPMPMPILDCLMMDMDYDGDVDLRDFAGFQRVFGTP